MRPSLPALAAIVTLMALGSCVGPPASVPEPEPVPVPAPTPAPAPRPTPAPPPPPRSAEWRDWPVAPGGWAYRQDARGSIALYGRTGADAELTLRCDRERGQIFLSRRSEAVEPLRLTVRTSSTLRTLAMQPSGGTPAYLATALGPRDALLDAMGFSRGKLLVEGAGTPALVLPAWAEILRVVEDCRA